MTAASLSEFRAQVEAFLARTGMAISRFGDEACNDRSFVTDMRTGRREFRFSTIEKVTSFMKSYDARLNNAQASSVPSKDGQENVAA